MFLNNSIAVTIFLLIESSSVLHGQIRQPFKPPVDTGVFEQWPTVMGASISADGKYALYNKDIIVRSEVVKRTLVMQATNGNWKTEISGTEIYSEITSDGKYVVLRKSGDSVAIVSLGNPGIEWIPGARLYQLSGNWFTYNTSEGLKVRNLTNGQVLAFEGVTRSVFSKAANALVLQIESKEKGHVQLKWMDLSTGKLSIIWEGTSVTSLCFDDKGRQLAFTGERSEDKGLWHFRSGSREATLLAGNQSVFAGAGMNVNDVHSFSFDGERLLFNLRDEKPQGLKAGPQLVLMNVWSDTDPNLKFNMTDKDASFRARLSAIDLKTKQIRVLECSADQLIDMKGDCVLFESKAAGIDQSDELGARVFVVTSISDGKRLFSSGYYPTLSPTGKYLVYYDAARRNYYSYETSTARLHLITNRISTNWTLQDNDRGDTAQTVHEVTGWIAGENEVLLHDRYDIWKVDLEGRQAPLNITNGYGARNDIVFNLASAEREGFFPPNAKLLLSAFNRNNKENGFYRKAIGSAGDPEILTMGPYVYFAPDIDIANAGEAPVKAKSAEAYLVRRMSEKESPNYFFTSDFKTFSPLTDLHTEKQFNWYTTELYTWNSLDGRKLQGILYKPENFDESQKYPLICYYYEKLSNDLHVYQQPGSCHGPLNIPWFVSNGYLVFTPDIHYVKGKPGQSAYNSVVSAAQYLSGMSYVDPAKLGLHGHSFGGYETNYLVTHSNLFAAACSSAGVSDFISMYCSLQQDGYSRQAVFEHSQLRMDKPLWEMRELYIENSPVFFADRVSAPLLLLHNRMDNRVPFDQGLEFFLALRRLRKKVWMLQYDGEGHTLSSKQATMDFSVRLMQFFDHYLKGAPTPRWMAGDISPFRRSTREGLELNADTIGR